MVPNESDVDVEAAMKGGAVKAEEDAVGDGGPGGVLGVGVEAHLHHHTYRARSDLSKGRSLQIWLLCRYAGWCWEGGE